MNVIIYNADLQKVAYLENAYAIGYETPLNSLWRASFSLPADDEKNEECTPLRFVEIFDGPDRVDLFRITPSSAVRSADGQTITYQCEHVLATLLDDVLFQYHTIGNVGYPTEDVIEYVLSAQTVTRWQSGTISFARQFEYNWENENLLSALFSIPKPFVEEYMWTWDTTSYPWSLNLIEPTAGVQAYIRYGYNLQGITKTTDPMDLCTRLYCLGYGEGVNQLTISEVNGGVPYLDADTQGDYGIISRIFTDRRFDNAETLKSRGQAILDELKTPRITYEVDAAELYALTEDSVDKFIAGTQVRIIDEELGVDVIARVVNKSRPDITGQPGAARLEIANKPIDIANSIAELADRQRISETYAQGATNVDSHDFSDNCDTTHPAILKFWVPAETTRINKVTLTYESTEFRGYTKSIEAAPATSSGPSSTETTAAGGATVNTQGKTQIWDLDGDYGIGEVSSLQGGHAHTVVVDGVPYTTTYHPDHQHGLVSHYHYIDLPDHSHEMPHTHQIPAHTHGIEFGIFEGPIPTEVTVRVDGNEIIGLGISEDEVDIVPYLAKDSSGQILRGQYHTIEIAPNDLGRIVATVNTQLFVQSRGGGNY